MIIRPKSPLGLKYLQIIPGDSSRGLRGRAKRSRSPRPAPNRSTSTSSSTCSTRRPARRSSATRPASATRFAGRGPQLNEAFGALRRLVESAQPALRNLVAPSTNFGGFWRALEDLSATVAPVAETQASMFVALDRTFAAFARVSRPYIQETISKSPPTLDAANADLPVLRPFLHDSERFFTALKPGAKALAETSPTIAAALRAGIPVLNASPVLNAQLPPTAEALLAFQRAPGVFNGLDLLIDTNRPLGPAIKFIAPAQTTCNYLTLAFRNLASASSERQRARQLAQRDLLRAAGRAELRGRPRLGAGQRAAPIAANHLHYNPYPNTASPGQPNECEAGNELYTRGQTVIGNAPGNQGTITAGQIKGQGAKKMSRLPERDTRAGRHQPPLQVAAQQRADRGDLPARSSRSAPTWPSPTTCPSPATATS